ncbi:MAG TPA: biotin transporter BioY, partial [Casimicrobiaceae bacterium]
TPLGAPGLARFLGPTGGYLIAYPAAAFIAGALAKRSVSLGSRWMAAIAGIAVVYVGGIAQLALLDGSVSRAVQLGVTPFALLDLAKAFGAALVTRWASGSTSSRRAG